MPLLQPLYRGCCLVKRANPSNSEVTKQPANLASLPSELIWEICQDLGKEELLSLCLTSRRLRSFATPLLYSSVNIKTVTQYSRLHRTLRKREDLAPLVKELRIRDVHDEAYKEAVDTYVSSCAAPAYYRLLFIAMKHGWRHPRPLRRPPRGLPHLQSLKSCTLNFTFWNSIVTSISYSWVLFTHPTLETLRIYFPSPGDWNNKLARSFRRLDLDSLASLRGTTALKNLGITEITNASALTPLLALPRHLETFSLQADTLGPVPVECPEGFHTLDSLSPLFDTIHFLELAPPSEFDGHDTMLRSLYLSRFKSVTELRFSARHARLLWPERRRLPGSGGIEGLRALLPPKVETLVIYGWDGRQVGPPCHVFARLTALAEEVAAARYTKGMRVFPAWTNVVMELKRGELDGSVALPATVPVSVGAALQRIGVGVRVVNPWEGYEYELVVPAGAATPGVDDEV